MKKINRNPYSDLKHYISFLFAGLCTNSISCPITIKPSPLPTSVDNGLRAAVRTKDRVFLKCVQDFHGRRAETSPVIG